MAREESQGDGEAGGEYGAGRSDLDAMGND